MHNLIINDYFEDIKHDSMMVESLCYPLCTVAFIDKDKIFVTAYHRKNFMHYHMFFDLKTKECVSKAEILFKDEEGKPICSASNFPQRSFYSQLTGDCYTFFRQG